MNSGTESVVNLSAAALIWLFGVLVFLPTAEEIDQNGLSTVISLTVFLGFSVFIVKGLKSIEVLIDTVSSILVGFAQERKLIKRVEKERVKLRVALEVIILVLIYLSYSPFLVRMHPSINGIAFIVTLIVVLFTLVKRR